MKTIDNAIKYIDAKADECYLKAEEEKKIEWLAWPADKAGDLIEEAELLQQISLWLKDYNTSGNKVNSDIIEWVKEYIKRDLCNKNSIETLKNSSRCPCIGNRTIPISCKGCPFDHKYSAEELLNEAYKILNNIIRA